MKWTETEIKKLIDEGKLYKFYKSKEWKELRKRIIKENNNECQWCKEKGKVATAVTVHHVQFVKKHPGLAMSEYYTYKGKQYRNLIPLCHDCHDRAHERIAYKKKKRTLTEERW